MDTEATGLLPWGNGRHVTYEFGAGHNKRYEKRWVAPARPFAFSWCDQEGTTGYRRVDVDPHTRRVSLSKEDVEWVEETTADDRVTKIGHNIGYDLRMYEASGIRVRGPIIDTMILAHIATAGSELTYALKPLCKKYVDYSDADEQELKKDVQRARHTAKMEGLAYATVEIGGREPVKADYWMGDPLLCQAYAVGDVERCILLWHLWYEGIQADPDMVSLFQREHELFWVLKKMEDRGVRVFPQTIRMLRWYYKKYQVQQIHAAEAHGGKGLNYGSVKQMTQKFYVERGHTPSYTERGNFSLTGERLLELANGIEDVSGNWIVEPDPLAKAVLEYKAAGQTISTFLDVYERYWVKEADGYILHPNYRQTGTITGRLSCSDPNLMQVASATTGRRKADIQSRPREGFGPRDGYLWYLPDYSQIEIWVFAYLAEEEKMQQALLTGRDFHGGISAQVFGKYPDYAEQSSYYRKCAKLIMFCKLYGGGVRKMAKLLRMTESEAARFIERWEAELPGVPRFMSRMINRARRDGVIRNPFGRRYSFGPDFAYKSVNYLIQGTAADIMKNALVYVDRMLSKRWPKAHLLLTIHDEIIIEVPLEYHSKQLMREIIVEMQRDSAKLGVPVPLPVGMKVATRRWHRTFEVAI